MNKTFEVKPVGKKFETIMRQDGMFVDVKLSKRKILAIQKGYDWVVGPEHAVQVWVGRLTP